MAKRVEYTFEGLTKKAWQEENLILWQYDDGTWTILHDEIGIKITTKEPWSKKADALKCAKAMLDYKDETGRKIDFSVTSKEEFYRKNPEKWILETVWPNFKDL